MNSQRIQPAPIVKTFVVQASREQAFAVFAEGFGRWWPTGGGIAPSPHVDIVIEPRAGGRWFERAADGSECDWGSVLAYEPPGRLLLAWQLTAQFKFDPAFITELEVTFLPEGEKATRVTLEHRNLERYGEAAEKLRNSLDGGWDSRMKKYSDYLDSCA